MIIANDVETQSVSQLEDALRLREKSTRRPVHIDLHPTAASSKA